MPFPIRQAPGGGTSPGQALGGVLEDANKDKLAIQALNVPGVRESMGADVADFITKGPGAHKRFGAYMAQADKLSGGKVSKMNRIVQSVSKSLEGRQNVKPEEILQLGYAAMDADNQANPNQAAGTKEDVDNLHKQIFRGPGRTTAPGKGEDSFFKGLTPSLRQKVLADKEVDIKDPEAIRTKVADITEREEDVKAHNEAFRKLQAIFKEDDPALAVAAELGREFAQGAVVGGKVDLDAVSDELIRRAREVRGIKPDRPLEGGLPRGPAQIGKGPSAVPAGSIRVRVIAGPNKGRIATIPEADFDPRTMEKVNG